MSQGGRCPVTRTSTDGKVTQCCSLSHGHEGAHQPRPVHRCHWPGCQVAVPPKMWGCRTHWYTLPRELRERIWATYRPGQEITKDPSDAYLKAAAAVQAWAIAYERGE